MIQPIEGALKIKKIYVIKDQHSSCINSICELKDKRLVSCSRDESIIVYSHLY